MAFLLVSALLASPTPGQPRAGDPLLGHDCTTSPAASECDFTLTAEQTAPTKAVAGKTHNEVICQEAPLMVPEASRVVQVGDGNGPQKMVQRNCTINGQIVDSTIVFIPVGATPVRAQQLAQQAYQSLVMPRPDVEMSPAADVPQLTGLPVWLWLKPSTWTSKAVTLSAGGVTVTATATPQRVLWSMGDETTVTCTGPGTPFPAHPNGDGTAPSPTCGHTFHRVSTAEPGGSFHATATTVWRVGWTGFGPGGTFPDIESSVGFPVRVIEAAALVTNSH